MVALTPIAISHRVRARTFSMNLAGPRIAVCLEKAALKTHALQTLRACRMSQERAKRLECVRFIGAFRPAREGQRVLAAMHEFGLVDALHESERRTPVPRGVVCPAVQYRAEQESGAPIWILIIGVSLVICHSDFRQLLTPSVALPRSVCTCPTAHGEPRPAPFGGAWNSHCSPKNPVFAIPPGARDETGTVISTIAQSGSLGT